VAFNVAVIVEGAFVRATGPAAGCGNHWPMCNGQVVFGTPAMAAVIEFAHRSMTGIDTVMMLGLLTAFLFTEALIGAALVKFGLVVNDASAAARTYRNATRPSAGGSAVDFPGGAVLAFRFRIDTQTGTPARSSLLTQRKQNEDGGRIDHRSGKEVSRQDTRSAKEKSLNCNLETAL
jgi:heme A synthase